MTGERFEVGRTYSRSTISERCGGSRVAFAPTVDHRVTCLCIDPDRNPKAPECVFLGSGPQVEQAGERIPEQKGPFPTFLKVKPGAWEFLGNYRFRSITRTKDAINRAYVPAKTPKNEVTAILSFQRTR